ncbi:protein PBDC1 isoform X1 [Dunckerocampus dactyliophorus]|uniref:protein PBDC1 isoform X1 n=1 Tax=Dunckerocampus dactyliophorus TaxID=161453 RepID=UPI002405A8E2|nr:protein PBDC1 isoform X1 [Dunckerocampus dactyliophorus]
MCYYAVHLRRIDDLRSTKMASSNGLTSLGPDGASAAAHALSLPAEAYGNDERLEVMWAMKAYNHAEVYFNLISSVDPKFLKLTKLDDEIYSSFKEAFEDLQVKLLNPDDLKSSEAKERWRPFCNRYEDLVEDFNYGTLLRLDCEKGYTEENTIFATRIQFFAIEIARNREGFNDVVFSSRSSKS